LVYEILLISVVLLNVIKNEPFKWELLTILLPFIKRAPSCMMSIFLFFLFFFKIFLQVDFLPFNKRVKQVFLLLTSYKQR